MNSTGCTSWEMYQMQDMLKGSVMESVGRTKNNAQVLAFSFQVSSGKTSNLQPTFCLLMSIDPLGISEFRYDKNCREYRKMKNNTAHDMWCRVRVSLCSWAPVFFSSKKKDFISWKHNVHEYFLTSPRRISKSTFCTANSLL